MHGLRSLLAGGLAASMAIAAPHVIANSGEAPFVPALSALQPGLWAVRSRDPDGPPPRQFCLGDPRVLLQLRHHGQSCRNFVVSNEPTMAVVTYSCPGRGNGRTTIRVETPRLAQIESSGIADQSPFDLALEARRIGECPVSARTPKEPVTPLTLR
ncbi:MAG: DUF3617 domain-containing protein [Sphingomonadaceae bacterium]